MQTQAAWALSVVGAVLLVAAFMLLRSSALRQRAAFNASLDALAERRAVLTPTEIRFLARIEALLPEFRVLAQVSMGALLRTRLSDKSPLFWNAYRRFGMKIVDFVIVDRRHFVPLLVVELDDRTHDTKRDKDAERDAMLWRADIFTVRFDVRSLPDNERIRQILESRLQAVGRHAGASSAR